jgi:hypothetical protein
MAALPASLLAGLYSEGYQIIGELHPTATMKLCASSSLVPVAEIGQGAGRSCSKAPNFSLLPLRFARAQNVVSLSVIPLRL